MGDIFAEKNVNAAFNNFLNTYLRIFYSSFPLKKVYFKSYNKALLTPGLKISCINKRRLFLAQRSSNDPNLINYYKRYCKILSCVIKSAKQRYYNSISTRSKNKAKTKWTIVKNNSNTKTKVHNITSIKVNGNLSCNGQIITDAFSKYFASAVQSNYQNVIPNCVNSITYLFKAFTQPFLVINLKMGIT